MSEARDVRDALWKAVRDKEKFKPRTMQVRVGPSQVGNPCDRSLAFAVAEEADRVDEFYPGFVYRPVSDPWRSIVGTAVHAWLDEACQRDPYRWITDKEVTAAVRPSLGARESVSGRFDLYDTETHMLVDHKVLGKTSLLKLIRQGPKPEYRVQSHLYALGLTREGFPVKTVAIAAWARDGLVNDMYLWSEPYDYEVARLALGRLGEVRAAVAGGAGMGSFPTNPVACRYCPLVDVCMDAK